MWQSLRVFLTESGKSPASIARSNKQWVGFAVRAGDKNEKTDLQAVVSLQV